MERFEMSDLVTIGATIKLTVDALAKAFPRIVRDGTTVLLVITLAFGLPVILWVFYQYREVIYAGSITLAAAFGIDVNRHWQRVREIGGVLDVDVPPDAPGGPRTGAGPALKPLLPAGVTRIEQPTVDDLRRHQEQEQQAWRP